MVRLNPVPTLLGLLFVVFADGCKVPSADFSPDGKSVVITRDGRVTFRDVAGKRRDVLVPIYQPENPKFSPDGKLVAVDESNDGPILTPKHVDCTWIIDRNGFSKFAVPGVTGPFAWRPDGTELFAFSDDAGKVIHIQSRQVVRTYPMPKAPQAVAWIGDRREVAIAVRQELVVLQGGTMKSLKVDGSVLALAYDSQRDRIVWVESDTPPNSQKLFGSSLQVRACDPSLGNQVVLVPKVSLQHALCVSTKYVIPYTIALSPDGNRLLLGGLANASKPGIMERYDALGGFRQYNPDKALQERLHRLEDQLRIDIVCTSMPLDGPTHTATRFLTSHVGPRDAFPSLALGFDSANGDKPEVLLGNKVYTF